MKKLVEVIVVLIALLVCSCSTNYVKKVQESEKSYLSNGYEILESSGTNSNESQHYLLLRKDGIIYLDYLEEGKPLQQVFPPERGVDYIKINISIKDGIPTLVQSFVKAKVDVPSLYKQWFKKQNTLYFLGNNSSIFYHIGDNYAYAFIGEPVELHQNEGSFSYTQKLTLADLFDKNASEEEFYFDCLDILSSYPFLLENRISIDGFSSIGFSDMKIYKTGLPTDIIKEKLGADFISLLQDDEFLYIPASWMGTARMELFKNAVYSFAANSVEIDLDEYDISEEDLLSEDGDSQIPTQSTASIGQLLAQQPTEEAFVNFINDNMVDFRDMCDDYTNTVKAERKYVYGNEIILRVRADEIKTSNDNYSYLIKYHGALVAAHIYTNDDSFSELDYPVTVWILAKYKSRYQDFWGVVYYEFTDAQLLSYGEVPPRGY